MQGEVFARERAALVPRARGVVLDVGAGSATNIPYFSDAVTKVIALEPSRALWELGKSRVEQASMPVQYIEAGAEAIPLKTGSVDTVVSAFSLCTIPNASAALREMHRVLKPSGQFIFIDHGTSPKRVVRGIQTFLTPVHKIIGGGCHLNRDIPTLVKDAGFRIVEHSEATIKPLIYLYRGVAK